MKFEEAYFPAVVIGGGITGICAAISLSRQGIETALVQDRSVLGGNSSCEIGVPIGGADHLGNYRHARETGIIDELLIKNAFFPNPSKAETSQGFSVGIWSMLLWSEVRKEKIKLFLNTIAKEPRVENNKIKSIIAEQYSTEKTYKIKGDIFIDCSGDGRVAYESGAEYIQGREGRNQYDESLAPEIPDNHTMGNSVYIRARDTGHPISFKPPEWAHIFEKDSDFPGELLDCPHDVKLLTGYPGGYWWIEFGGLFNTIEDSEFIHDELIRYAVGVWGHIKNHGNHGADNYVLDWISVIPGKRESRRFIGDHVLNQSDLENLRTFDDVVAFGGWNMDIHYPHGIAGKGQRYWHGKDISGRYGIPLASLYSKNIENLLFAGRNISATQVAFGSSRVMATCAVLGQAVGNAAYLCLKYRETPREVRKNHIKELQQNLLRQDAYLPGIRNEDTNDLALQAIVSASSEAKLIFPEPDEYREADTILAQSFFASQLDEIALPLRNTGNDEIKVKVQLRSSGQIDYFHDTEILAETEVTLPKGDRWVDVSFNGLNSNKEKCYQVCILPKKNLFWGYSAKEPVATNSAKADEDGFMRRTRGTYCLRLKPDSYCYNPKEIISGVGRPEKSANVWISKKGFPQWLELRWEKPVTFDTVRITFDNNIDRPIRRIQDNIITPELVKDYDIFAKIGNKWIQLASIKDNHLRLTCHRFEKVTATALKLMIHSANGIEEARVIEARVGLEKA